MTGESIVILVKQLHAALEQCAKDQLECCSRSPSQGLILGYLFSRKGESSYSVDLHAHLGVSKSAISSGLKKLRQSGFIQLLENPEDDRKKRIVLTEKALDLQKEIDESLLKRDELLCYGISEEELARTRHCLLTMRENLRKENERRIKHGKNLVSPD